MDMHHLYRSNMLLIWIKSNWQERDRQKRFGNDSADGIKSQVVSSALLGEGYVPFWCRVVPIAVQWITVSVHSVSQNPSTFCYTVTRSLKEGKVNFAQAAIHRRGCLVRRVTTARYGYPTPTGRR